MKKKVFLVSVLFLILILPIVFAASDNTESSESQKVAQVKECLKNKIDEKKCKNLGFEEKLFSLLSVGECEDEFLDDSDGKECWPGTGCTIKATAQALIALENSGQNTEDAEDWLLDQKTNPSELVWYLQIESSQETKCTISYSSDDYTLNIEKEKQLSNGAGSCLTLSEGGWWLRIAPSCYEEEFEISCDQNFLTNLLFKQQSSSTIHVSEKTTTSSANGVNTEKVESFCFGKSSICDYEGSLWAAIALDYTGNEITSYLPYLITLSEDTTNAKFIPESFLYYLTDSYDFRNSLLLKQKANKYWEESGDRFYDTALALIPITDEPPEKTNSKNWLLDNKTRDSEGCWKGSISATGFILYSVWPSKHDHGGGIVTTESCEDNSGFCLSSIACSEAGGISLDYSCSGMSICCDKTKALETCWDQGGEKCSSDQICQAGVEADASDLVGDQICCIQGSCTTPQVESECVVAGGFCKLECSSEEKSTDQACDWRSDTCCVVKEKTVSNGTLWIWILSLGILIILLIIGYIYRDKLKAYWLAFKKRKSSPPGKGGPFFPTSPQPFPPRGIPPRRMIPPSNMPTRPMPARRPEGDMEDVLKKLKEMGK